MAETQPQPARPDLKDGLPLAVMPEDGMLVAQLGDTEILLVRRGAEIFAIEPYCSHYHAPLIDGLVVDGTLRCPWHHACFDLRSGEALRAPAFATLARWSTELRDGRIFVREREAAASVSPMRETNAPDRIVIVGGGAAGFSAAEALRRSGYSGGIVMLSDDEAPPVDRPNLSKDFLAGGAPEEWVPLQRDGYYRDNAIDLRLGVEVAGIDPARREVRLADGAAFPYDRLLLATGAAPLGLPIPGAEGPHVHVLRSLADCRRIIAATAVAQRAVVIGASFIGLECAASLRARGLEVHVVAPEARPMERILGAEFGDMVRELHEEHGVIFHLGDAPVGIGDQRVALRSGGELAADFVVLGVGVRPRVQLAERAGLRVDRGVVVDEYLETSAPGIFAAGDIARWPDPHSGELIRVEHWVVAQRQGRVAAANMLGQREPFDAVPFFWSQHYDIPINYVGHAESFDEIVVDGDIRGKDCLARYRRGGRTLAVAAIFRDLDNLCAEYAMERERAG